MKSYHATPDTINREWKLIDLSDKVLGRVATQIVNILKGKTKPVYTPSMDTGDFVVAINANKLKLTGRKLEQKMYYKHTGYMGGIKQRSAKQLLATDSPKILIKAVKGMIARGPMGRKLMKKLKVYAGPDHPHTAQKPQVVA
ncbi:MAG: 50S ribosomal protein L13 [Deltaproteobacteria bacterium]|nr:50S ribosomal protein L13 [Deltaproteobacteria bacterium]